MCVKHRGTQRGPSKPEALAESRLQDETDGTPAGTE